MGTTEKIVAIIAKAKPVFQGPSQKNISETVFPEDTFAVGDPERKLFMATVTNEDSTIVVGEYTVDLYIITTCTDIETSNARSNDSGGSRTNPYSTLDVPMQRDAGTTSFLAL